MDPQVIDAGGVRLRPHRADDVPAIVEQCIDPESQRWTTVPSPYGRADAEEFVDLVARGWEEERSLAFALADPATDAFLGSIDLRLDGAGAADIGYGLHPGARGRGLTTVALRAVADWAFAQQHLALQVLQWSAIVGNWASRRAAWRVGFRVEGTLRGQLNQRGTRRDTWCATLLRDDPRQPRTRWLRPARLTGAGVVLRPFRAGDAEGCVEACTDPRTRHWLPQLPDPYTAEAAAEYIATREEEHAADRGVFWCAADPVDDRMLGSFGLHLDRDGGPDTAELGYLLHPAARGRGIATTAARLVRRHAFAPADAGGLGLRRLVVCAAQGNEASVRVAQRAGFVRTGVDRAAAPLGDGTVDDMVRLDQLASTTADGGREDRQSAEARERRNE
ncbi:MAG: GNAT family N-acetyltransferase [Streptosporangiales bacterium]|nr:GNAT family N-acetyltransferase [Streptosporangiales bacterium]